MLDPRINLKQPWLAALLAFLLPGAGHLYQGRHFKAAIYFCCILGLFASGMQMSDCKAVYLNRPPGGAQSQGRPHVLPYLAQVPVGAPALYAIVQNRRYYAADNIGRTDTLKAPLTAEFEGEYYDHARREPDAVSGRLELVPKKGDFRTDVIGGRFVGTREDGSVIELTLNDPVTLDPPISADPRRGVNASVVAGDDAGLRTIGSLSGSIARPFRDWFEAPLDSQQERDLHRNLGKFHELAMVFTWVAGLLNILAIWDAYEGPAYGYGDEPDAKPPEPDLAEAKTSGGAKATAVEAVAAR
jgi:hypothetical protein